MLRILYYNYCVKRKKYFENKDNRGEIKYEKKRVLLFELMILIFSCNNKINADSNKDKNNNDGIYATVPG